MTSGKRNDCNPYICPLCGAAGLNRAPESVQCGGCSQTFRTFEDVIDFSEGSSGATSVKDGYDKALDNILRDTASCGWLGALQKNLPGSSVDYATDPKKSDFLFFLPLENRERALDLGCGLGPITMALAREFQEVYALDAVAEQARFVSQRARQEGFDHVSCCVAPRDNALPFADSTFDLVVLSGVIEWMGTAKGTESMTPVACQLKALQEAYRVLRPGGLLYMTTKNPFALRYFLWNRDEHSGLRFSALIPQPLIRSLYRWKTGHAFRVRMHTPGSTCLLLNRAGFREPEFWALLPSFREPRIFVGLEPERGMETARRKRFAFEYLRRAERICFALLPAGVVSRLVYCYAAVARKGSAQ